MNEPMGLCDSYTFAHTKVSTCVNWRPHVPEVSSPENLAVPVSRFDNLPIAQKDKAWTWWFDQTPEQRKERIITMMRQEEELKQKLDLMKEENKIRAEITKVYREGE